MLTDDRIRETVDRIEYPTNSWQVLSHARAAMFRTEVARHGSPRERRDHCVSTMIARRTARTRREHRFYLEADLAAHGLEGWHWPDRFRYPIVQYQRLLRHVEYLDGRSGLARLVRFIQVVRLRELGMKLGFSIPRHVFDPGLSLAHYGSVVVNGNARVGRNARVHSDVNIGESDGRSPVIGNDVYIGPGAKVFGPVHVGDGVVIGANAVVNRDVRAHVTVGGVPAKVINDHMDSSGFIVDGCAIARSRLGYTVDAAS